MTPVAADPNLSVFDITVTTATSQVALVGTVVNEEQVAQAVTIAMEAGGVERVVSKLAPGSR